MLKPLTLWITTTVETPERNGDNKPTYISPEKLVCGSRGNSQNKTLNNGLVQNWEKTMPRLYTITVYLTYIQNTSCKMPGWMNHKLETRLPGEISTTSDMQMIPL